jgi:hypothetical protein
MREILLGVLVVAAAGTAAAAPPSCPPGYFPATGQTTEFTADRKGAPGAVVPGDGAIQAGATLSYVDNGNGTVTDLNTGLMWENKVPETDAACTAANQADRDIRCAQNTYPWASLTQDTIFDWLEDLNASAFAGYTDWRIPNLKELQSILDYGRDHPAIHPVFVTPDAFEFDLGYWTSTTHWEKPEDAWIGIFTQGVMGRATKTNVGGVVRAVRAGCM